jgi:hypothetical protein
MQRASPVPLLVLLAFGACIVACMDPRSFLPPPTVQDGGSAPTDTPPPSDSPSAPTVAATPSSPAATHRLLGILDPERDNMVAFALKVPIGWEATQSFTRVLLRLRPPDGAAQIEYRPIITHSWSEGPIVRPLLAHHSHLTARLRRVFGYTPTQLRARVARTDLARM